MTLSLLDMACLTPQPARSFLSLTHLFKKASLKLSLAQVDLSLKSGTGLGEGYLTRGENSLEYSVHGSEGGHTDFPPRNEEEFGLLQFARKELECIECQLKEFVLDLQYPLSSDMCASDILT